VQGVRLAAVRDGAPCGNETLSQYLAAEHAGKCERRVASDKPELGHALQIQAGQNVGQSMGKSAQDPLVSLVDAAATRFGGSGKK
jgi:hypothetical protein